MSAPRDLFSDSQPTSDYSAKDIEVLEGLEPVRRRPGMYIGGTDERALHHLAAEIVDNAMDEAVAGHANRIELQLDADGSLTVRDNGRGIPVDRHPKRRSASALEVILTTLHAGGKFNNKVYHTAGGLHGVGASVVNALSDELVIEVARDRTLWRQSYCRGKPTSALENAGSAPNRRGTMIKFHPDPEIFGGTARFQPRLLYTLARAKAYLYRGVELRWRCDPALIADGTPATAVLRFPGGLADYLSETLADRDTLTAQPFIGQVADQGRKSQVEWAIAWPQDGRGFISSYCNTVPTTEGGSHEVGLRQALTRGLKAYGELTSNRRAQQITAEDIVGGAAIVLSIFIPEPQFQGQTKERLSAAEATRLVDGTIKDHFDHWLSGAPEAASALLNHMIERAEDRIKRRQDREVARKSATRRLRLPGKLADCSNQGPAGTEIFLVEGDSAGGSAKQARNRRTQAILPLRGKILNVANAASAKTAQNQELANLLQALGCGTRERYSEADLRYERVVIMTDADVDGAHIAALLMTFFFRETPQLITDGHLFLAMPPLYRLTQGGTVHYARDDAHREALLAEQFSGRGKVDVSRFKGLGEMLPAQLRETTMDPAKRQLQQVRVDLARRAETAALVERLMGRRADTRLAFIQENAAFVSTVDI